jgi:hypothetical protein
MADQTALMWAALMVIQKADLTVVCLAVTREAAKASL